MFSRNACEEKTAWDGLFVICVFRTAVADLGTFLIKERFLFKSSKQRSRNNWQSLTTSRLCGCKLKWRRRCCVRCRQTTKHLKLRSCRGESNTGETRSNYIPRREMSCVHMALSLEQRTRRASHFHTSFSTLLPWQQRCRVLGWGDHKQFVVNRLRKTKERVEVIYRHVPTEDNPAHLASRDGLVSKAENQLW